MAERYYEIGKEFYLIRSKEEDFHRNIYLKRFVGEKKTINMLMDPGTNLDIANLTETLKELIGGIQSVDMIFLSHQDPDVTSNCNILLAAAPKAFVVASIDTWRLIHMYGIPEKRFISTEQLGFNVLSLKKTKHKIQFVPARFCHFRGSMMFYDLETNILFTGDFLGGVNSRKGNGYTATNDSWRGISTFHQLYMPSKEAIYETVHRIGMLDPLPTVIAPQHGDVVTGNLVNDFLLNIVKLDVGIELRKTLEPEEQLVLTEINKFLDSFQALYPDYHSAFIKKAQKGGQFTTPIELSSNMVTSISVKANEAFFYIWETICKIVPEGQIGKIKTHFVLSLNCLNLPIPAQLQKGNEDFSSDLF
jgi:glyoxylase-like metal-dependent hydrolase (beta-lactamase superfamily II)